MKKVGIDIRILQNDHKYRGIGEVARQTLTRLLPLFQEHKIEVIFYRFSSNDKILDILTIPNNLIYSEVNLGHDPTRHKRTKKQKIARAFKQLIGQPIKGSGQSDYFIQFDYSLGVPSNTKTILVKHDIIPLVFWHKFFSSPLTHFKNKAARTTLRTIYHNNAYKRILKRSLRNAYKIIAVSEHTKADLQKYLRVPQRKVSVQHLGVAVTADNKGEIDTSILPTKPYLLYVGAVDANRRSLEDLVAAYNNLKAQGDDIQLVLVGENFKSEAYMKKILPENSSRYLLGSSYNDDILKLGYINDATKQYLYRHALSFVFPTRYEGFGMPILEAMINKCLVITYSNSSTPEVAGGHALFARNWEDIKSKVEDLQKWTPEKRQKFIDAAYAHAKAFSWDGMVSKIAEDIKL
jgi:glycosyltransferase involved in cell wall biosynthesis